MNLIKAFILAFLSACAYQFLSKYAPSKEQGLPDKAVLENIIRKAQKEAESYLSKYELDTEEIADTMKEVMTELNAEYNEDDPEIDAYHSFNYADRHVVAANEIARDPDCMSREFDLNDPSYDKDVAVAVLAKCRILVLRNVYQPEMVANFKTDYAKYLRALKSSRASYVNNALFNENFPSKRYEIFLPESLNNKEITENEAIMNIVKDPLILDRSMFMHSLGSVVTEPGASHQDWHEEDDYIFDSSDSFFYHGVAGHDLPPYTINLFTPLLNLTYDHGPTEFCVGSSLMSGLTSWHGLYDQSLSSEGDGSDFQQLLEFYSDHANKPCPPQFLRSALLNVGDVLLFDYQIIHRAGYNQSPDTRAQVYIAYARSWFRDLNYHVNTHGDPDDAGAASGISTYTRFALFYEDDAIGDCETTDCKNEPPIETLRDILPQGNAGETKENKSIYVSNVDLEGGSSISVNGIESGKLQPGINLLVEAPIGGKLSVHSPSGDILKTWIVPFEMTQLMVSKAVVGGIPVLGSENP